MDRRNESWAAVYGDMGMAPQIRQTQIPLSALLPWESSDGSPQPFHPYTPEALENLAENIRMNGIIEPIHVRPITDGRFQILAGHNRCAAARLAGLATVPALVESLDDDQAAVRMVDSNLFHRETLLPSEKAFAYKVKLSALCHQGKRMDSTSDQVGRKLESAETIAEQSNDSKTQVRRYIRLTYLLPALLELVDEGKLKINPGVELSYLNQLAQRLLLDTMAVSGLKPPSLAQAKRLRALAQAGALTRQEILNVYHKPPAQATVSLPANRIRDFFPPAATAEEMEEEIIRALIEYRERKFKNG